MSHPFGDLVSQHLHRKHGLSQSKLAAGILQAPTVITAMCKGRRLVGPQARERVVAIIGWLHEQGALDTLDEANALLNAAGMSGLTEREIGAANLRGLGEARAGSQKLRSDPGGFARPQRKHNLPAPLTSFIGREKEITQLGERILTTRLLTLTGAGGVGKTRLALEVAGRAVGVFADGVWLVELAALSDPALVPQMAATALKLSTPPDRSHLDALADYFEPKHALLILDNCEHVITACAALIEHLLRRCPQLHILATSRETLRVPGEVAHRVPSLSTPDKPTSLDALLDYESVRLFVERTRASVPGFEITPDNAAAMTRLCQGLDGIPLALELVAALAHTLTVNEILERLEESRFLSTPGYRTSLTRHETMRRALDWSYGLLSPTEQRLLARLSVFAGGWTSDAAEAVCGEPTVVVAPLLDQLVHKSLLVTAQRDGRTRYRLLEPIRQYADEKLREMGEWKQMRDRHVTHFVIFAEQADVGFMGYEHGAWLKRLTDDYANLLAALTWSRDHDGMGELHLRLAISLWRFWTHRGDFREGADWLESALARCEAITTDLRVKALTGTAWLVALAGDPHRGGILAGENLTLSHQIGNRIGVANSLAVLARQAGVQLDHAREIQLGEESVRIGRQTQDVWMTTNQLRFLALSHMDHDLDRATKLFEEALEVWRKMDSTLGMCAALFDLGTAALRRGAHNQAYSFFSEALVFAYEIGYSSWIAHCLDGLSLADLQQSIVLGEQRLMSLRETGDTKEIALTLHMLGHMVLDSGDFERAGRMFEECLLLWRELGNTKGFGPGIAWALHDLGHVARYQGNLQAAVVSYMEALNAYRQGGNSEGVAWVYSCLAYVLLAQDKDEPAAEHFRNGIKIWQAVRTQAFGTRAFPALMLAAMSKVAQTKRQTHRSARLAGAAAVFLPNHVLATLRPIDRWDYERIMAAARAELGRPDYAAAWAEGAAMALDQAVAYALAEGE